MPVKTLTRTHKAITLVPLAVISGLWTASLASGASAERQPVAGQANLPTVPAEAIEDPASVAQAGVIAPGVPRGTADTVVDSASISGIPSAALSAYQRAAQIIDSADKSCKLGWEIIAAIGRVESDHGRYGGNVLTPSGLVKPGIYGIPLDGKNGTQEIRDTDGGQLDQDPVFDRAVGPMQFIPGTWSVVKVDADGDGQRNPQNINDAALATAVYLCSGSEDMSTEAGQRKAIFNYNRSTEYVDLVLRIAAAYASGDYSAVPTSSSYGGQIFSPDLSVQMGQATAAAKQKMAREQQQRQRRQQSGGGGGTGGAVGGTTGGTTGGGSVLPGGGGGGTGGGSVGGQVGDTVGGATGGVTGGAGEVIDGAGDATGTGDVTGPVTDTVTRVEALAICAAKGIVDNPLTGANELERCVATEMG